MSLFSRISPPGAINTSAAQSSFLSPAAASTQPTSALPGATGTTGAAAPTGTSLFGQTQQQQPPGSAPATGTTFGQTAATTAPVAGGLFGASTAATTSGTTGGGLFGATPAATTTTTAAPAAGGLFGASTAGTGTTGTTGGLFGQTAPAAPAAGGGGGLFGASTTAQPTLGSSLFGGQQQQQPQQQQQQQPAGLASSLFGGQQQQQPQQQQSGGMFGGGNSMFGGQQQQQFQQSQMQQPQQQQAVDMNFNNLRGTTRYEELNDLVKKQLDQLDEYISKQIKISTELDARAMGQREAMESVEADVDLVSRKYATTNSVLLTDGTSIGHLQNNSSQLLNTAALSTRTIDILRLHPSQRSAYLPAHHTNNAEYSLIPYFQEQAADMERRAENYMRAMGEVERTLESMEKEVAASSGSGGAGETRIKDVVKAERMVFSGMVAVAGRVAGLNEDMKDLHGDRR